MFSIKMLKRHPGQKFLGRYLVKLCKDVFNMITPQTFCFSFFAIRSPKYRRSRSRSWSRSKRRSRSRSRTPRGRRSRSRSRDRSTRTEKDSDKYVHVHVYGRTIPFLGGHCDLYELFSLIHKKNVRQPSSLWLFHAARLRFRFQLLRRL